MLKKRALLLLLQLFVLLSQAQTKLNTPLLRSLYENKLQQYTLLVEGDIENIRTAARIYNGRFNYSAGNIASVTLPAENIKNLAALKNIKRIELVPQNLRALDDSSLRKNNILPVHNGMAPLTAGYTGKGVLIGIIDTGTDIHHPDFKDSTGKTRLLWIWDQRSVTATNTPQPYNYGQQWSNHAIDSGLSTHIDNSDMSHGTKVAGVAAGNGASASKYKGIAPEAGIISVAISFSHNGPVITDAVDYILKKANAAGMPVVINISLGDYYGSHDGKDLQSQLIDNLMGSDPGRALVAAAGNAGEIPFHLGYNVSNTDTNFTWIENSNATINFQVYSDSADLKHVKFRIGASNSGSFTYKCHTGFNVIDSVLGQVVTDTLKLNGNRLAVIETAGDFYAGVYALDVTIKADSLNLLWSFETNGTGKIDGWNFDFKSAGLPTATQLPAMNHYKRPDTLQTICTGFQCSKKVITVGNYTNRLGFTDVTNTFTTFPGTDGGIYPTSSLGPTRDGRIKPEITAGGENIATTGGLPILTWLIANFPYVVTQDSLHMIFGGTSASAPAVTGLAALYFEKYPLRTSQQLKADMINCSLKDSFTGSTPNNTWGYGKLDGFGTLTCSMPSTAGLNEFKNSKRLNIYPNPAGNSIMVDPGGKSQEVILYDMMGKPLLKNRIPDGGNLLDLSGIEPGIYFLKSQSGAAQKVIIARK